MTALYAPTKGGILFIENPRNTSDRQRDLALTLMALSIHDDADLAKVEQVAAILAGDEVEPPPPPDPELPKWKVIKDNVMVRKGVWGNIIGRKITGNIVTEYEQEYSVIKDSHWIRINDKDEWICYKVGTRVLAELIP